MSIEATNDDFERYTTEYFGPNLGTTWNSREVAFLSLPINWFLKASLDPIFAAIKKCEEIYGTYQIGGGGKPSIGFCLQGHRAYHSYLQDNYRPILLCNQDGCPFELYKFMRYVEGNK